MSNILLGKKKRGKKMEKRNDVEIRVFASPMQYASRDAEDEPRVAEIIQTQVLPKAKGEYFRVDVRIKRRRDDKSKYLVAYLLRKDIYLAEVVKIDVETNYGVSDITWDYEETEEEEEQEYSGGEKGEYTYDFVAATPVPEINSAKNAVEYLYNQAVGAGLKSLKLLGSEASVANYKKYLTGGLKGFVNIGHGSPSCIILADGSLCASWFKSLLNQPLKPAVAYFNSCQVFNDPMKSAQMQAGARTFIGGIINLLIGPSEEVCKSFWNKSLTTATSMGYALEQCEKEKYPVVGAHGITGDTESFVLKPMQIPVVVALWQHVGFGGYRRLLVEDTTNLVLQAFNDKVSAIGIHRGPDYDAWKKAHGGKEPTVGFYEHINYGGRALILTAGAYANIHSLFKFGDVISSVKFNPPFPAAPIIQPIPLAVEVYEHANFKGKQAVIVENVPHLINYLGPEFNDIITSVKVKKGPNYTTGKKAQLFQHVQYKGKSIELDIGEYPNIGKSHNFNDVVSSIKVT